MKKWPTWLKLLICYSALTLGVTVENKAEFYTVIRSGDHASGSDPFRDGTGDLDSLRVDTSKFDSLLRPDTKDRRFFIPFILWVSYNTSPHALEFTLKTKERSLHEVRVDRIKLVSNGIEKDLPLDKACSLSENEHAYYDFSGYSYGKTARMRIPDVIREGDETKVTVYYTVYSENQEPQSFADEATFKRKRAVKFSTGIMQLILGIGASGAA